MTDCTQDFSRRAFTCAASLLTVLALAGCGNYGGDAETDEFRARNTLSNTSSADGDSLAEFSQTVYPIVRDHCAQCHGGTGPGSPQIAHGDVQTAYFTVLSNQKVSFSNTVSSRLVQRLASDQHYCWGNCVLNGAEMNLAIEMWRDMMGFGVATQTTEEAIASMSMLLDDGVEQESGDRETDGQIAFWDFKGGVGEEVRDKSGVDPRMDLQIQNAEWMDNYGLHFENGLAIASVEGSQKLYDHIASPATGSQAYTVEAWLRNSNQTQDGPARIVSYSINPSERNFALGQVDQMYNYRNRSVNPEISPNGNPALETYDVDEDAKTTLQHVVVTFDQLRGRRIYVDGVFTDDVDENSPSRLWNWDPGHRLVLGNETTGSRPWAGRLRLVAIYDRVLSQIQITHNYNAGVGKKVKISFDVTDWAGADSAIEFVVSEFDDYSYLFCEPTFVTDSPNGMRIKNIEIRINGVAPVSGQAFRTLDTAIFAETQKLTHQCAVIPKDLGIEFDEFSIEFEAMGDIQNLRFATYPTPDISIIDDSEVTLEGFRTFAQLSDSMSVVTGVNPSVPDVNDTYLELQEQLPSTHDLRSFTSAHQIGIAKLSLEFCDALVESPELRTDFFGDFSFDAPATTVFTTTADRAKIIDPLVTKVLGTNVNNQPTLLEVQPILDDLVLDLVATCGSDCGASRTQTIVKATCSAVLSSGAASVY